MKQKIAIYGGTELSAAESRFIESMTYALLTDADVTIITGGFHYSPQKMPGAISTDFSVLQGAQKYANEKDRDLKEILETWLPDPDVETDPHKKDIVRFKMGVVRELKGASAQARRFSMIRDVDVLITVKGEKHTSTVLDFALTMNKPALPLAFTGGDSRDFWKVNNSRVKMWFDLNDELDDAMEVKNLEECSPELKNHILRTIIAAVYSGLKTESRNQQYYKEIQDQLSNRKNSVGKKTLATHKNTDVKKTNQLNLFLSYAHEDVDLKNQLDKSLIALKRDERISIWQDTSKIAGGDVWDGKIKEGLDTADIILLLISADFMNSEYIWNTELPIAKQRHDDGKSKVIPIFLRDVFEVEKWYTKLQGYISLDKPIAAFTGHDRDTALKSVVQGISNDINKWLNEKGSKY